MPKNIPQSNTRKDYFIEHTPSNLDKLLVIQRYVRGKIRVKTRREVIARHMNYSLVCGSGSQVPFTEQEITTRIDSTIKAADTIYVPRTENINVDLGRKLAFLSKSLPVRETMVHFISADHVGSAIEEALFGQATLKAHKLDFRPASLSEPDKENGDGDVICFGLHPNGVDSLCRRKDGSTAMLEFDLREFYK